MKKLFSYLRDYKKECILGPLFKLLEASLELMVPLLIAALIDRAIPAGSRLGAVGIAGILVLFGVLGLGAALIAQYYAAKAACGFTVKLRHALFAHLQTFSYPDLDRIGTSTMITRISGDMEQLKTGVNMTIRLFLRSPFVVFGAMVMAFTIDWRAALIFVVTIPVLSAVVFAILLGCVPLYRRVRERLDGVVGRTRENLAGVRVIRAFRMEQSEREAFAEEHRALSSLQKFVGRIAALLNPVTTLLLNLAILLLVYVGALRVERGAITQGEVFALYTYMAQILVELVKLANLIVTMTKAVACGNRVAAVLEMTPREESGTLSPAGGIRSVAFRDVAFAYEGAAAPSLEGISFAVSRGETLGIIGATGSGKSTLVNLIPGFYRASEGAVLLNGRPVEEYDSDALRERIGTVPQRAVLFRGSVRDNMKWGNAKASDEEITAALRAAAIWEAIEQKGGLDAVIEQEGRNLSGGQRQRLCIARALLTDPDILIMDDSTSALDYLTERKIRGEIAAAARDRILFLVSQRPTSLRGADRILVLEDGRAVGLGTHTELLASCPVYREICEAGEEGEVDA